MLHPSHRIRDFFSRRPDLPEQTQLRESHSPPFRRILIEYT